MPTEGERVATDDIVLGSVVQGKVQAFLDFVILADGTVHDVVCCRDHALYTVWTAFSFCNFGALRLHHWRFLLFMRLRFRLP